jgi:hypothetical protein
MAVGILRGSRMAIQGTQVMGWNGICTIRLKTG